MESSVGIVTLECFRKLQYTKKDSEAAGSAFGWVCGQTTYALGTKKLFVRVSAKDNSRTTDVNFLALDILMAYNAILGHSTIGAIKAVIAPYLLLM